MATVNKRRASALLGLAFDGSRVEGTVVRRSNGSAEILQTFSANLTLDPLKDDAELVGRELRKQLDAAGIRERRCAVCIPLDWVLCLQTKLPALPEEDLQSFLQIEAERGFPYGPDALFLSSSKYSVSGGDQFATQVAVPRDHLGRLELALRAARLVPLSFSLGISALQPADAPDSNGVLALVVGERSLGLQVTSGGGVIALRTLEGAWEDEGGTKILMGEAVAREIRVTLGQLPAGMRQTLSRLRVFGAPAPAQRLTDELRPRAAAMGITVDQVQRFAPGELGVKLPADAPASASLALAARYLAGRPPGFEFLPPKLSRWQQWSHRYSSKKLVWVGSAAGAVAAVVLIAFAVQQWQLVRLRSRWARIETKVNELEALQPQIRKFRPWFDNSFRGLSILRKLAETFPEDGAVSAKTLEIRDTAQVTCSGVARDQQAFLKMLDQLRASTEVGKVAVDQVRGQRPLQFTFNFEWTGAHGHEN